jgi:AcrR family transcriptional regulator
MVLTSPPGGALSEPEELPAAALAAAMGGAMPRAVTAPQSDIAVGETEPLRERSLGAADWIEAAMDVIAEHGPKGIRIAALCDRLGVTKGSFYWHFESREDLLNAVLAEWRRRMTVDVTGRLESAGEPPAMLRRALSLIRKKRPTRQGAIERSVRQWARTDAVAEGAVVEVDGLRRDFFQSVFRKAGHGEADARRRAYVAYAIMMGDSVLQETAGRDVETEAYLDDVVGLLMPGCSGRPQGVAS